MRADIHYGSDGNPRGSGTVVFNNPYDAQNAIGEFSHALILQGVVCRRRGSHCYNAPTGMFNGAELNGMKLDVREERFSVPASGPFGSGTVSRGGAAAPPTRGGYGGRGRGGSTAPPPFQREIEPSNQIFVKNVSVAGPSPKRKVSSRLPTLTTLS